MTTSAAADRAQQGLDRFRTMLRGLRVSGVCVIYQNLEHEILIVENAPDFWPERSMILEKGDAAIFDEHVLERVRHAKEGVLAGGDAARIEVPFNSDEGTRWFELTVEPDPDPNTGAVRGLFVTTVEITDLKHREQILRTLLREVSHRSKNLLAIIQSIATQTARFSGSLEDFLFKFRGRIQSLSHSQDLVTDSNWRGARFSELVDSQLARYVGNHREQIVRIGYDPYLSPNAALHIGLAIHELAVNSAVFGMMSNGRGSVRVEVSEPAGDGDQQDVIISWAERLGVRSDRATARARFGSTVLEKVVPSALGGTADYVISDEDITYRLRVPWSQLEQR